MAKRSRLRRSYDPLAPSYGTQRQFNRGVTREAQAGYRPQLSELQRQGSVESRKHASRGLDINSMYDAYGSELQQAYDRTNSALNNLISQNNAADTTSQQTLSAALNASREGQNRLAGTVGGPPPTDAGAASTLAPVAASFQSGRNQLGGNVASILNEAAQRRATPALGKIRATEAEQRRNQAVTEDLQQKRSGVLSTIPGLRSKARQDLGSQEREKQNIGFQQNLAGKEFGLKVRSQAASEKQAAEQNKINWAQIEQQQQQIDASIDGSGTDEEAASKQALSDAFAKGTDWLTKYMEPQQGERVLKGSKKGKAKTTLIRKTRSPEKAFKQLTGVIGLPEHEALVLLNAMGNDKFRHWVERVRFRKAHPGRSLSTPPGVQGPFK